MTIKFNTSIATTLATCGLLMATVSFAATSGAEVIVTPAPAPAHATFPTTFPAPAHSPSTAPAHAPDPGYVSAPTVPAHAGQGETRISVALAKTELSKLGITHPTQAQLNAAQYGGTVTTPSGRKVQLVGVQTQRQSGMGWGQIAHSIGVKLGAVVSAAKSAGKHHDHEYAMRGRTDGEEDRHSTPYAQGTHDARTTNGIQGTHGSRNTGSIHSTGGIQRTSTTHTLHALPGDTSQAGSANTGGGASGGAGGGAGGGHGHGHK